MRRFGSRAKCMALRCRVGLSSCLLCRITCSQPMRCRSPEGRPCLKVDAVLRVTRSSEELSAGMCLKMVRQCWALDGLCSFRT